MNDIDAARWIAFAGTERVAQGTPEAVARAVKAHVDGNPEAQVLVFDAAVSRPVELDLRGPLAAVLARLPVRNPEPDAGAARPAPRPPGRPRLGVVAREVTLLPRHWDWLARQPGGASVALRKLVEEAQRANRDADRIREAQEALFRFMNAMAGNEPGFEEATRALFAGDLDKLRRIVAGWPRDVGAHVLVLADVAMAHNEPAHSGSGA
jgi:hypothetical protein